MTNFNINVIIKPDSRGARRVERDLQRTTKAANGLGSAIRQAIGFLGAGAAIRGATRTLASFQQEMSTVAAVTGATAEEFERLNERAIELGTKTRFSATQAAEGMTFLARAGFSASQAFETVDDTLQLAQAGALDLGTAADIASNVLTGFRLDVGEAARVVDVLALAANSSNTTVGQLGQAMKFVAPVAAGTGVAVEDTAAAISALSNAGLQASTAGTGLRRVIATLVQGTPQLQAALSGTGITLADVDVTSVGLVTALKNLAAAGIDTGTALQVFGQRGGPALEVLRTSIPDIERFAESFRNAGGTAARVAETMDDNLNGAILATKSALEGLILRLGESGATSALRRMFEALTRGLRAAADDIDTFVRRLQGLAFVLGTTLAAKAIPAAIAAVKALTVAMLANPIGAFAVALTAAAGAAIAYREEITLAEGSTTTFGDVLKATATEGKPLFEELTGAIKELGEELGLGIPDSLKGIQLTLQDTVLGVAAFIDASIGLLQGLGNSIIAVFTGIGPALGSAFFQIINGVISLTEAGIDRVTAFFKAVGTTAKITGLGIANFFREVDLALTQLAQGQGEAAATTLSQATDLLQGQVLGVGKTFKRVFSSELSSLQGEDLLGQLENPFEGAGGELADAVVDGFNQGLSFSGASDFMVGVLATADASRRAAEEAERLAEAQKGVNAAMEEGAPKIDEVTDSTGGLADNSGRAVRTLGEGLTDGFNTAIAGATDVAGAMDNTIVNAFGAAEDALVSFVTTGEFNFSQFVDGLLADLTRLLARQALFSLISSFGGDAAGAAAQGGTLFGGARAEGGPVNPNQAFLVGEEGPELFVPPGAGNIMTAAETAAAAGGGQQTVEVQAPPVNVSVVNVTDPDEVVSALDSPGAEQKILNVIARNRSNIKQSLA